MLAAVRERDAGQSVLEAFRAFLLGQGGVLAMGDAATTRRPGRCGPSPG